MNASFQGESIRVYHRAHIGIAVALEEGLITPVLRDCHAKSLRQIAVEARDLAERARARSSARRRCPAATFSISNLGMYDVTEFSAIINPPEGAILAVGHGAPRARRRRRRRRRRPAHDADDLVRPPRDGRRDGRALPAGREAVPRRAVCACWSWGAWPWRRRRVCDVGRGGHRARGIRRGDPLRAARALGRGGRGRSPRRRVPELGLHSHQGPAPQRGGRRTSSIAPRSSASSSVGFEAGLRARPCGAAAASADRMAKGVEFLFRKNKITLVAGPRRGQERDHGRGHRRGRRTTSRAAR